MKRLRGFTKLTWEREPLPGLRCSLYEVAVLIMDLEER